jgi:hypothetical protein
MRPEGASKDIFGNYFAMEWGEVERFIENGNDILYSTPV